MPIAIKLCLTLSLVFVLINHGVAAGANSEKNTSRHISARCPRDHQRELFTMSSSELVQARGRAKAQVTRTRNSIDRYIAEENIEQCKHYSDQLTVYFEKFETIHNSYHDTLDDDKDIESSDTYFFDVQNEYIASLKKVKDFIRSYDDVSPKVSDQAENVDTTTLLNLLHLPKIEFEPYDGDPLKFYNFMSLFDEYVDSAKVDDKAKLARLLQYTTGIAKNAISSCLLFPDNGYQKALEILKTRFGNHHVISEHIIKKIKFGKQIKSASDLLQFADDLASNYAILESMNKIREIDTQSTILDVVARLQPYLKSRWKRFAMEHKRNNDEYPNFKHLVSFVGREAEESNDPVYGKLMVSQTSSKSSATSSLATSVKPEFVRTCIACKGNHKMFFCPVFRAMKPTERLKFVKDKNLCENCLMNNHCTANCKRPTVCSIPGCGQKHTKFIHVSESTQHESSPPVSSTSSNPQINNAAVSGNEVCVPVVKVRVNNKMNTFALLDNASSASFCTQSLVNSLLLQGHTVKYSLDTITKNDEEMESKTVHFVLHSQDGTEVLEMSNVYVIDKIPVRLPRVDTQEFAHLCDLDVIDFQPLVEILIGQDHCEALIPLETRLGHKNQPFAVRTLMGWSLNGPVSQPAVSKRVISHFISTGDIQQDIQSLWNIEDEGISRDKVSLSVHDKQVIDLWDDKVKFVDGHFELPIPWKENVQIPNNISVALNRLRHLHNSLNKKNMFKAYDSEIQKLLDKGYAEEVPLEEISPVHSDHIWYLPHHAVVSESKPGKLRIVYDCASKFSGESLNDKALQGPDLNNKLLHVLLRFRNHKYAIMSDIEAMYYQVKVAPVDRDCLRFLWFDSAGKVVHLRMTSHVFGGIWCSSIATYALRRTTYDFDKCAPLVMETILDSFYVDDCLSSVKTEKEAKSVIFDTKHQLQMGGFHLTKFVINDPKLINEIPEHEKATEVLDLGKGQSKVLGVKWNVHDDQIYFSLNIESSEVVTKRQILSTVAKLYDPLGLVIPVLVPGKILLQVVTRLKLGWDEVIPMQEAKRWQTWLKSLVDLEMVKIDRCVKPSQFDDAHVELHHFSDASGDAYGCCSYLRCVSSNGEVHVSLLCSKGKVAPIKVTTIPRLELQAAVLAVRIDYMLRQELKLDLGESTFWVDSDIVLKYIHSDSRRFHVFVGNRVSEIQSLSKPEQWNHIAGSENPADIISRGVSPVQLVSSRWFQGPKFLNEHFQKQKDASLNVKVCPDDPEVKKCRVESIPQVSCNAIEVTEHPVDVMSKYYSSWYKLKKGICWWLRLKQMLKSKTKQALPLSAADMHNAELIILKHVQNIHYTHEIKCVSLGNRVNVKSDIKDLSPELNADGLLCVGGRLRHASLKYASKHQVIIPHRHIVSKLIAQHFHDIAHVGTDWTLALIRQKYWLTRGRSLVKSVKQKCIICKKLYARPCAQKMADLPPERLEQGGPPFKYTGIDCFGPILVKIGRSEVKRYGCLYTCFTTRAVHLEMLNSLETDSFLNSFRRFVARRGLPTKVWTDNGTNFVGAKTELYKGLKELDKTKIYNYCTKHEIEWNFISPSAPHKGGIWERLIQTVKRVLMAVFRTGRLTDEILSTVLCEVENMVNSRPMTKLSDDPQDLQVLTPSHLLQLNNSPTLPPCVFNKSDLYRKRWRHVQFLAQQFWQRWLKEYLPLLQSRNKWRNVETNVKVGDVVLLCDENTPRPLWPLAKISDVKIGRDGLVRTVVVKTKCSELVRPVTKIISLECM